ncbi:hypothetical protein N7478_002880 [Penicillium angulare]|uniref:uncharacterized protein n=1 Tax=Penicillium angulare TaxID=116970 RepID=UPI00253F7A12|nr:uncharacterized protein N7478_002880 [Penicillium angulare]KAJ5287194.1 hypothetical protein N7478_002880 [Penicillium angulare]
MDTTTDKPAKDTPAPPQATKRKANDTNTPTIQFTSRNPPWTYLKLQLIPQPGSLSTQPFDALSARTYLSSALSQYLGLTGTAIPIDILKVEGASSAEDTQNTSSTTTRNKSFVWIRVPRDDGAAVVAALSSWISGGGGGGSGSGSGATFAWRICAKGNYLGALVAGSGRDLFVP